MSSLITQDLSPSLLTAVPDQDYAAPAWSPVQPATESQPGLSDDQRALDQSVAEEAGLGPAEVATLGAFGLRPAELDPAAAARMAVGLKRLQALIACDQGDEAACDETGPGLVGQQTWRGVGGDRGEDLVVEDGEFTLRLSTRTTSDGLTERTLFYEDIDGTFLSGLSTDPLEFAPRQPDVEAAPEAPEADEEGLQSFLEGALLGDFAGNDTWSAVAGQAAIGFIPVVGQIADARDTLAAARDVAEGKDGAWMKLGAAAVGWIPGVGDALKGGARVGRRVTTEIVEEVAERTLKEGVQQGEKHAAQEGFEAVEERAVKEGAEDGAQAAARAVPQGIDPAAFKRACALVREKAGHYGDEIMVQGSRVTGTARPDSDMDIAILVDPDRFDEILKSSFKTPNPGSAKERTLQHATETGKIHARALRLSGLAQELKTVLGVEIDISVILRGGPFDQPPYLTM